MPTINAERLIGDLKTLRGFGATGTGVVRRSLTPIDIESRHWLAGRMAEAGLQAEIDGVGSVFGVSENAGKALLIGSHSDTQPTGGWLDGAMGVIYGLEVARALAEAPETRDLAVDVASWIDEEGTYYGLLGSANFCGEVPDDALERSCNAEGQSMADALRAAGLFGRPQRRLDRERHLGYLEAHIEQGPYLEETGKKIGVVTSIVGIRSFDITASGQQNHAGTTPMDRRRDALRSLIELGAALNGAFAEAAGPRSVWTIGRIEAEPGAPSIVPGRARMIFQFRDAEDARLERLEALLQEAVAKADRDGPCRLTIAPRNDHVAPAHMDAELRRHVAAAAEAHAPDAWMEMPSAAGHDAQVLGRHLPAAMIFVPSIGGVSHDFAEDTSEADIVLGCQVLADAAARILSAAR